MSTASSHIDFLSPLSVVPRLGPRRVQALRSSGMEHVGDLLYAFPRRYVDRSTIIALDQLAAHLGQECTVIGTVTGVRVVRGRRSQLRITISDGAGQMEAVWFAGVAYMRGQVEKDRRVLLTGTPSHYQGFQMVHPQVEPLETEQQAPACPYQPRYRITLAMKEARIGQKSLRDAIAWLLLHVKHYPATLPRALEQRKQFPPLEECIARLHEPVALDDLDKYRARIQYERFYTIALNVRWSRRGFALPGRAHPVGPMVSRLERSLLFELTAAQRDALGQLHTDAASPRRMHRLLQGDVGSGKTVVVALACVPALENGFQVAWLTPTDVLARQTWATLCRLLKPLGIEPALLTASSPAKRETVAGIGNAQTRLVVGRHALLTPSVTFAKLGMIVIDEQHRFGLEQRMVLQRKGPCADFLLMSATPIPLTLARTIYGDLDLVTIRGLPPGRRPVKTHMVPDVKRVAMETFIREQIEQHGAQAYYVVPRIQADDEEESEVKDLVSTYETLVQGAFRGVAAALVHGRLPAEQKERAVREFSAGTIKLLAATTVVEVGIDAPGATIMVVEDADRFGLSTLHQLRGRVGRSDAQAYCFLLCAPSAQEGAAGERLRQFCHCHDGFALAELDLKLRGPGHLRGVRQSGWDDRDMGTILDNLELYTEVREEVAALFERDGAGAGTDPNDAAAVA